MAASAAAGPSAAAVASGLRAAALRNRVPGVSAPAAESVSLEPAADAAGVAEAPPVGLAAHLAIDSPALQELEVARGHWPQGYRWVHHVTACWVDGPPPCASLRLPDTSTNCRLAARAGSAPSQPPRRGRAWP